MSDVDDDAGGRTDLDETRRLLYMVLLGGLSSERWYNLAGTLTNALAHHSKLATAAEVMERLHYIRDVSADTADWVNVSDSANEAHEWVQGLIDQITEQLDD